MIAAKMANIRLGEVGRRHEKTERSIDLSVAAKLLGVSKSSVQRARKILDEGTPEDIVAVEAGEKTVSADQRKSARSAVSGNLPVFPSRRLCYSRARRG